MKPFCDTCMWFHKKCKSWRQKVTQLPETFVRLMKPLCGSDVRGMDPHNGT